MGAFDLFSGNKDQQQRQGSASAFSLFNKGKTAVADPPAPIFSPPKKNNTPAIPSKNLLSSDPQTGNKTFQLPGFLGGGAYTENSKDQIVNKGSKAGHTTYGGEPKVKGQQRDDIISVGLGGENTSKQNIRMVPYPKASEQDKVETQEAADVKAGKIKPKAAITDELRKKEAIANEPGAWGKFKALAGDVWGGIKTGAKIVADAPKTIAKDINETIPTNPLNPPKKQSGMVFKVGEGMSPDQQRQAKVQLDKEFIAGKNDANAPSTAANLDFPKAASDIARFLPRGIAETAQGVAQIFNKNAKAVEPKQLGPLAEFIMGDGTLTPLGTQAAEQEQKFKDQGISGGLATALAVTAVTGDTATKLLPLLDLLGGATNEAFQSLANAATKETSVRITANDLLEISRGDPEGKVNSEVMKAWTDAANKGDLAKQLARSSKKLTDTSRSIDISSGQQETAMSRFLKKSSTKDIFKRAGKDVPFTAKPKAPGEAKVSASPETPATPQEQKLITANTEQRAFERFNSPEIKQSDLPARNVQGESFMTKKELQDIKSESMRFSSNEMEGNYNRFVQRFSKFSIRPPEDYQAFVSKIPEARNWFYSQDLSESEVFDQFKERYEVQRGSVDIGAISEDVKALAGKVSKFIDTTQAGVGNAKNLEDSLNLIRTNNQADFLQMKQLLNSVKLTPADAEAIYHFEENKSLPLTLDQQQVYEHVIKPLADATEKLVAKLKPNLPLNSDDYTPRFVMGKGSIIDRLMNAGKAGFGNILSKAAPSLKSRTMKAIIDEKGNRSVVSVKGDRVTAFDQGQRGDLGAMKMKTNEEIRSAERIDFKTSNGKTEDLSYEQIQSRIKKLEAEERAIVRVDSRATPIQDRIDKIQEDISRLEIEKNQYDTGEKKDILVEDIKRKLSDLAIARKELKAIKLPQKATERLAQISQELENFGALAHKIDQRFAGKDMKDKYFVGNDGGKYKIADATTKEIEANTNLKYSKNVLVNRAVTYMKLAKAQRAFEFLEQLKASPEFKNIAIKFGEGNAPDGWKQTRMPAFTGYLVEPHVADALDKFAGDWNGGDLGVFQKINNLLRTSIFFNPLIHVPNIMNHWLVNRGVSPFLIPKAYKTLFNTSLRAARAIMSLNEDYVAMLRSGASLQFMTTDSQNLNDILVKKLNAEIEEDPQIKAVKKAIGLLNPYKLSNKVTWFINDFATMQAIYEDMDRGLNLQQAIEEIGKHIPNYRVPSRIMNSRLLSKAMTNSNITMFGAYHYGALKSYVEMAKQILTGSQESSVPGIIKGESFKGGKEGFKERAKIADKLLALGLITFILYPAIDKAVQKFTKNKNSKIRRAGASTFIYNTTQLVRGKIAFPTYLQSFMTPSIGTEEGLQLVFNRDLFTGSKIYQEPIFSKQAVKDVGSQLLSTLPPVQTAERAMSASGDIKGALKSAGISMIGISTPKVTQPQANIDELLYNQKSKITSQIKKALSNGNKQQAQDLINQFNDQLRSAFESEMQDEKGSINKAQIDQLMKKNEIKMPKAQALSNYKKKQTKSFLGKLK